MGRCRRTTATDPSQLVARWFENLFGWVDFDVLEELVTEDVRYHGPRSISPGEASGREAIEDYVTVYRRAFPDLGYSIAEVVGSGDVVTARWSLHGTLESDLLGLEPTGETVIGQGISVFHVSEDGRFKEIWSQWDTFPLTRELELLSAFEKSQSSSEG